MDGPITIKVKKKYTEHKTEWASELLFKTPDLRSHKFWKIKRDGNGTIVNYGRYGKKARESLK